jgi:hypothetical protein
MSLPVKVGPTKNKNQSSSSALEPKRLNVLFAQKN